MKKFSCTLFFSLLLTASIVAQSSATAIPSATAPANASVAYADSWGIFHNPAILTSVKNTTATLGYENKFFVSELSTASAGVAIPTKYVQVGVALSHFGYSAYSETQVGIALARSFTDKFSMGVQFNYYSVYFSPRERERSQGVVVAQIGLLSELSKGFYIGFNAYNPAQTNIKTDLVEKRIPSIFNLGAMYRFSDKLLWLAQVNKEIGSEVGWATGFEYQVIDVLSVRLGGYGSPFVPSLGVGLKFGKFRFDANFEQHPALGISSVGSLKYEF